MRSLETSESIKTLSQTIGWNRRRKWNMKTDNTRIQISEPRLNKIGEINSARDQC
jgi:hypothetical protein